TPWREVVFPSVAASASGLREPAAAADERGRGHGERYLTSTLAPASSSCALIESASSRLTPSLTGPGAPSTRSFASLRPRLVIARTTLITWIFLSPAPVRTTSNDVCSSPPPAPSPPAAGAPPAAATAAGAAAVMPHSSSILLFSSTSSRTVIFPRFSKIVSTDDAAMTIPPHSAARSQPLFRLNSAARSQPRLPPVPRRVFPQLLALRSR